MDFRLHLLSWAIALFALVTIHGQDFKIPKIKGVDVKIPKIPKDMNVGSIDKMQTIDVNFVKGFEVKRQYEANGELSCIQFAKDMLVKGLPAFNDCMKEMQLSIGKLRKKLKDILPCLVKCIGQKLQLLQPDGTFNIEYTKNLLSENVPKRFMEYIWKIWDACETFVKQLEPNDPTCKTYKPLIKCAVDAALKIATEAMKLCPDIPDVFKNTAKGYLKSKKQRKELDEAVGLENPHVKP